MRTIASKKTNANLRQAGMASILVTMVLMVVMSLIVLGFAQVSRSNQRAALDSQLSKQAYYAAETGINDYAKIIKNYLAINPSNPDLTQLTKSTCAKPASGPYSTIRTSSLDGTSGVQYTCVLVTANPTSLNYGSVNASAHVIPINAVTPINNLTLIWQSLTSSTTPANNCPSASSIGQFPAAASWTCGLGILRVDVVPTTGSISLNGLQASTMTAFLVPTNPTANVAGTVSYSGNGNNQYGSAANQGAIVPAKCSNAIGCTVTINNLGGTNYYLRVSSVYQNSSIQVAGYNLSNPSAPLSLIGAQVLIDATGKDQDVLRRIQVRIPINAAASNTFDSAIITSQSLCKQFETAPTLSSNPASLNYYKNDAGC